MLWTEFKNFFFNFIFSFHFCLIFLSIFLLFFVWFFVWFFVYLFFSSLFLIDFLWAQMRLLDILLDTRESLGKNRSETYFNGQVISFFCFNYLFIFISKFFVVHLLCLLWIWKLNLFRYYLFLFWHLQYTLSWMYVRMVLITLPLSYSEFVFCFLSQMK